jgi:hypothetical protein
LSQFTSLIQVWYLLIEFVFFQLTASKEVAMDVIISVSAKIAEYMVVPIGRQFGYIL